MLTGAGEKAFSLGAFYRDYVARLPVAVVRQDDRIVAFATLWLGGNQGVYYRSLGSTADQ